MRDFAARILRQAQDEINFYRTVVLSLSKHDGKPGETLS